MEELEGFRALVIVCPLIFLGGIVDAIVGGGGLITIPAYLLAGLSPHGATATNKCSSSCGSLLSTIRFFRQGDVHLPSVLVGAAAALGGSWIGARLNMMVPEQILYYIMLAIVPVVAVFLLVRRDLGREDRSSELSRAQLMAISLSIGLVIGGYDGFFGPGSGTFMILGYTALSKFDLLTASGNSKAINFSSNIAALVTYALAGKVVWLVGIPAALCSVAGNYVGSSLAFKGGAKIIRPMFFVVLALLLGRLIYDLAV